MASLPGAHMKKSKFILSLVIASTLLIAQMGVVFAAPATKDVFPILGNVQKITVESDPNTGVTTVLVKFKNQDGGNQTVRLSKETAKDLGLVTFDGDGNPVINEAALGLDVDIDPATIIPNDKKHPVGSALANFFSDDIQGLDYKTIMDAHVNGNGFGVIAQALWIVRKLGGNADDFVLLLDARKNKDFSDFRLKDGTIPTTWGQLKKAVSENLGTVMSHKDKEVTGNNGNSGNENSNTDKGSHNDKDKDKSNNGKSNENGNINKP